MTPHHTLSGILGGTFDPIHNGHIEIAKRLLRDLPLTNIQLIPNNIPPHRTQPIATAAERLAMARLATAQQNNILVNDIDLQRAGPSYMVDTLQLLHAQDPTQTLCLIIGEDQFDTFNQWHQWQRILELAHLIVINRPTLPLTPQPWRQALLAQHATDDAQALTQHAASKIFCYITEPLAISAQAIRAKLAAGEEVTDSLSTQVVSYIKQKNIYNAK